jgi:hypothetical protein
LGYTTANIQSYAKGEAVMSIASLFRLVIGVYPRERGLRIAMSLLLPVLPVPADITVGASPRPRGAVRRHRARQELHGAGVGRRGPPATGKDILHLAPLAVSNQLVREAEKFGIAARVVVIPQATAARHQHHQLPEAAAFRPVAFGGVILDESSILKSTDGHYRTRLIEACQSIPFRLAATATPAPNDFMELGNHAEFLGIMSYTDMLATFFTHDGGDTQKWRLKGHAENEFWKWMASWAVMLRKPSDLGYSDDGYDLPPLQFTQHMVGVDYAPNAEPGCCSRCRPRRCRSASRARAHGRERVALAASITPADRPFVWWCNLNAESERSPGDPRRRRDAGSDPDDVKERKLLDFSEGRIRVLVSKPSVCGFGMNWQHCADTGFVGLNDSFEQFYQAVRRFWRFGQTKPVNCHIISRDRGRDRRQHSPQGSRRRAHGRGDGAAHGRPVERGRARQVRDRRITIRNSP